MLRKENKNAQATAKAGQAAIELAVFGAILIFILGTIVRTAVGNSYGQNQNFKAMRMAMLSSWTDSKNGYTAHNSASILFIEDRLSPDISKYGDLDRNPFVAQGSGDFSYELEYPWDPTSGDPIANFLPVMDIYINGQHFPFTVASFVINRIILRLACPSGGPYPPPPNGPSLTHGQCIQNQCLRNFREWAGGVVNESMFEQIIQVPLSVTPAPGLTVTQTINNMAYANASAIFNELAAVGLIGNVTGTDLTQGGSGLTANTTSLASQGNFISSYASAFPNLDQAQVTSELNKIQAILQSNAASYKLFYTQQPNGSSAFDPSASDASIDPPFDLQRNNMSQYFVPPSSMNPNPVNMRPYMAWQWSTSPATNASSIGLNPQNNEFPWYDIDGRLQLVSIYALTQEAQGEPNVSYEDLQGGDMDNTWTSASCSPKPGLQSNSSIFTFTKQGTYLEIKEGGLYNPENDQYVRSVNQRDTIDLIQRTIQLSNNTGRFCGSPPCADGSACQADSTCASGNGQCAYLPPTTLHTSIAGSSDPNPVEICVDGSTCNCFMNSISSPACGNTIAQTCYDVSQNKIFVRSRLEDQRGHYWMTDTSGQMSIK